MRLEYLDRYTPYALAALRIVTALIFIEHGTQKLFAFPAPPASGLPALLSLSGIGGIMELVGGLFILVGAFTRPVAFLLSGEMAVAYWMFHAPRSVFPLLNGETPPSSTASCSCSSSSRGQAPGASTARSRKATGIEAARPHRIFFAACRRLSC